MTAVNEQDPATASESLRVGAALDVATYPALPVLRLARPVWLLIGAGATVAAVALSSPWILAAWITPDLALLAGGLKPIDGQGRLNPAAVRAYNASHALVGPALLGLAGVLASPAALAAAALWLSHIGIDRALGYGLRAADGSQRG